MTDKTLTKITQHLFPIRNSIGYGQFDYPDYGDLPKNISYRLSSEAVDAIQDILRDEWVWCPIKEEEIFKRVYTSRKQFQAKIKLRMKELGERFY